MCCLLFAFRREGERNIKLVDREIEELWKELGEGKNMIKIYCVKKILFNKK